MITCRIPVGMGNELAKVGSHHSTIQSIMEKLKPEAAYFSGIEGTRSAYIVVNMDDASQIAAIVEPLLLGLGAAVQIHPVMSPEELGQATRRSSNRPRSTVRTARTPSSSSMSAGALNLRSFFLRIFTFHVLQ
jgi:hypothetical protein